MPSKRFITCCSIIILIGITGCTGPSALSSTSDVCNAVKNHEKDEITPFYGCRCASDLSFDPKEIGAPADTTTAKIVFWESGGDNPLRATIAYKTADSDEWQFTAAQELSSQRQHLKEHAAMAESCTVDDIKS